MPNRILKESICVSETIDALTPAEECMFYRLLVNCDDYGRMDARAAILKARLFPLRPVTEKELEGMLVSLERAELISLYRVQGRPYLQICTWESHQSIRAKRSKYPSPHAEESACEQMHAKESSCEQLQANVPVIQSESQSQSVSQSEECTERGEAASAPKAPPPASVVISLPLNNGAEQIVTPDQLEAWQQLYPAVDVAQELRAMRGWLMANKNRRKTDRGIERFTVNWLKREQDRGRASRSPPAPLREQQYAQRIYREDEFDDLSPDQLYELQRSKERDFP